MNGCSLCPAVVRSMQVWQNEHYAIEWWWLHSIRHFYLLAYSNISTCVDMESGVERWRIIIGWRHYNRQISMEIDVKRSSCFLFTVHPWVNISDRSSTTSRCEIWDSILLVLLQEIGPLGRTVCIDGKRWIYWTQHCRLCCSFCEKGQTDPKKKRTNETE